MITKERAERAKSKLLETADKINKHIAKVREIMESDFLTKWNGKAVSIRVGRDLAARYGLEEIRCRDGSTSFKGGRWGIDYLPPPLHNRGYALHVNVCNEWGEFSIPIFVNENNILQARGDRCNSEETKNAWEQVLTVMQGWADKHAEAADYIEMAAKKYNEIEQSAVDLMNKLKGSSILGLEITTLSAFGGDIYERLNPFRWDEKNREA
jgi:hypothetical protein